MSKRIKAHLMGEASAVPTCSCGHVDDEHGQDPKYPGSSSCTIEGCECICFELDDEPSR